MRAFPVLILTVYTYTDIGGSGGGHGGLAPSKAAENGMRIDIFVDIKRKQINIYLLVENVCLY